MLKVCGISSFLRKAENLDEVICYGAGHQLKDFAELFKDTIVLDKCKYVVDRNKEKQGSEIYFGNVRFSVISPEALKTYAVVSCAIVITCLRYEEIIEYFESDKKLNQLDYYCLYYFKLFQQQDVASNKAVPDDFKIYDHPVIPKTIHYCWFGKKAIPDQYKRWMESWYKYCPDYEIKEWNETNYDISKNKYMLQAYENEKWGFVPDYARLDIIYHYGGIYLDTDIELVDNLDDLLYQDGFIGFQSEKHVNCGMGFGAVRGLEIIKEMRDCYKDKSFLREDGTMDLIESPYIQTDFLKKRGLMDNGEYQIVDHLTVYPEKVLGGKNLLTRKIETLPYTKSIHHFSGSWMEKEIIDQVDQLEQAILRAEQDEM
ncbi:MAG: hypothetical protein K1W23_15330 [Lachnospiraceae bacterium]|jgi:hypothetical protein